MVLRVLVIILPGGSSRRIILGGKSQRFRNFRMIRRFRSSRGIRRLRKFREFRRFQSETGARVAPRCDFRRLRLDLGTDFSGFSRLHRASDSTRSAKGRTSVFADRRSTFKGSQTLQKKQKSTKIDEKSLRQCFANAQRRENSIFPLPDATWCRFWSPRHAPRRSRAPFLASRGTLGDPPDAFAARRGRSETLPRRSRDAPETPSGRS